MAENTVRGSGVFYKGPSQLDGSPIVGLVTGLAAKSGNDKTGAMVQTHICRADVSPADAIRAGLDAAGPCPATCPHRSRASGGNGSCYTHPSILRGHGTSGAWRSYAAGRYRVFPLDTLPSIGEGRDVRLGSYGDPAAVPLAVWEALLSDSVGNTGYTHAWRDVRFRPLARYCMASVDSPASAAEAVRDGWRFYLPEPEGSRTRAIEGHTVAQCPAAAEAGKRVQCSGCPAKLRCSGTRHGSSIAGVRIGAHGSGKGSVVATA